MPPLPLRPLFLHASALLVAALSAHCTAPVSCGPGTRLSGSTCVLDNPADAMTPADASPDAPPDGATEAGPLRCASQCDCPAGTTCTIDGVCTGSPFTQLCSDSAPCPCGRPCDGGACGALVGTLRPCAATCECGYAEACARGRCVNPGNAAINARQTGCTTTDDCAACSGTICLTPASVAECAAPDRCAYDGHCLLHDGPGLECLCPEGTPTRDGCTPPFYGAPGVGHCAALEGPSFFAPQPYTVAQGTQGDCGPSAHTAATLTVTGVPGSPTRVLFYAEFSHSDGVAPFSPSLQLSNTADPTLSFHVGLEVIRSPRWLVELELGAVATPNGTWRLCTQDNASNVGLTLDRWGIYFRP